MTWRRLLWFDLTRGLPTAAGVLRRRLGFWGLARLLVALAWRSLGRDPLARLGPVPAGDAGRRDRFARHQLRPVLLLEAALREVAGLDPTSALEVTGEVVARTGARFLADNVPTVRPEDWARLDAGERRGFVGRVLARMFNATAQVTRLEDGAFAFDVTACLFASMAATLGRPEIAALYCAADGAWFDDPASPVALTRAGTLARGAARCDFHFAFKEARAASAAGGRERASEPLEPGP